jgi:hypothetical protein
MEKETLRRIAGLKDRIDGNFTASDWRTVGLLTDHEVLIQTHPRLLRSLNFGDDDYGDCVLSVLKTIAGDNEAHLDDVEKYLDQHYPSKATEYVSAAPAARIITFSPTAFQVPEGEVDPALVSVMMPFASDFNGVYAAIKAAVEVNNLKCERADNVWEHATIIQDIFSLIFRSRIVIVDFTGKNPNVMYETGIAHTLGKVVIPITQSIDDVPFDIRHHRVQKYLPNTEGLEGLKQKLTAKIASLIA